MVRKEILFTGGTGCIGSRLSAELLKRGHFLYFISRSNIHFSAEERIIKALGPFSVLTDTNHRVIELDITADFNGDMLQDRIDEVWHCAASLSFREDDRIETFAVNAEGTRNLLGWMERRGVGRLHHVSTAYVAGDRQGRIYEDELFMGQRFHNPYEESKAQAETMVKRWAERTGGRLTIYRPSIVVGDSQTGEISAFMGYYILARSMFLLKRHLLREIDANPELCESVGIRPDGKRVLVPVSLPGMPSAIINIMPIDILVGAMVEIGASDATGVFHLVNARPPRFRWITEASLEILGLGGIEIREQTQKRNSHPLIKKLEEDIDRAWRSYWPYVASEQHFNMENTRRILGREIAFDFTLESLRTLLSFAVNYHFKGRA